MRISMYMLMGVSICVTVCLSVLCQRGWGMCREVLAHYVLGFTYLILLNAVGQKLTGVDYNAYFNKEVWKLTGFVSPGLPC